MSLGKKEVPPKHGTRGLTQGDNVYLFPTIDETDPLKDPQILRMLRVYHAAGCKTTIPASKAEVINDPIYEISHEEAQGIGLTVPAFMVRAPASQHTEDLNIFRHRAETPTLRITAMIVGAWVNNKRMDHHILDKFMRGSLVKKMMGGKPNVETLIHEMLENKIITEEPDGALIPTRMLLYRAVESVAWMIDTMAPLCEEFQGADYALKFQVWPDINEEIPDAIE